ncbi:thioredoxin [Kineothrix sp. MB12-C1]|uniref:thioredoxin n=1 Tax=Kineothrix sp. MB12-C1 TaxID=3070215 RepID=UPI0027D2F1E4|nr:thioredoxin [Kineothrix sp. MB12-C1]WMC91284.1 thioredoxin [Kineothrix sp. MB12-C1]
MEYKFTTANFDEEVLKADIPVLVDFYADWCGPCKMMAPIVEKLAQQYEGRVKVGKCNIDDEIEVAQRYRVMSIPTFIIFKGGEAVSVSVGAVSQSELENKLQQVL